MSGLSVGELNTSVTGMDTDKVEWTGIKSANSEAFQVTLILRCNLQTKPQLNMITILATIAGSVSFNNFDDVHLGHIRWEQNKSKLGGTT